MDIILKLLKHKVDIDIEIKFRILILRRNNNYYSQNL